MAGLDPAIHVFNTANRHWEERSDASIQLSLREPLWIASLALAMTNQKVMRGLDTHIHALF